MLRWPDGTQQKDFLDAERFVPFQKSDAVRGRADAERGAALPHLLGRGLPRMRPAGETLIAGVIALIIGWDRGRIIVAPHQAGALTLLLEIPADELGATLRHNLRILMAVAGRHQRGTAGGFGSRDRRRLQRILIHRHEVLDAVRASLAAEQPAHAETPRQPRRLVAAAGGPQRRVRPLHRLREDLPGRNLVVRPLVRDDVFRPDTR